MKALKFFVIIILLAKSQTVICSSENQNIQKIIYTIPSKDRECLEHFFRHMIVHHQFGYVIFGNKPMVWSPFYNGKSYFNPNKLTFIKYSRLWKEYKIWLKYQHLFNIKNYVLRDCKNYISDCHNMILFFHREKSLTAIRANIELFKKKLGPGITPERIVHLLETKDYILEDVFKDNHDLLGILLGFGQHDAKMFQRRIDLYDLPNKEYPPPYDLMILKEKNIHLAPFFNGDKELYFINPPNYMTDLDHPESIAIRKDYFETQKLISNIYSQGRFLEITLQELTR